jgi:hypothetical protein
MTQVSTWCRVQKMARRHVPLILPFGLALGLDRLDLPKRGRFGDYYGTLRTLTN